MAFKWTHPSARLLAAEGDPVEVMTERARALTLQMIERGWPGPPFDPLWVANELDVEVVPVADAADARTVPTGEGSFGVRIEYNPSRPLSRRRFSLAHEVGHLLFPDVAEATRNRAAVDRAASDDWQLELLCNIAAAEIAMPIGSLDVLDEPELSMRGVVETKRRLDVSFEALLLRLARVVHEPIAVFAASRQSPKEIEPLRLDYVLPSRGWAEALPRRGRVPAAGLVDCTAVGFTASADVDWPGMADSAEMECVGLPPFPGHRWPRIVGLMYGRDRHRLATLRQVFGDATQPMGNPPWVIAHVVNDRARMWHGGFSAALRRRFPEAQRLFTDRQVKGGSPLGTNIVSDLGEVVVISMVAQAGYGPSKKSRLRYDELRTCLKGVAAEARTRGASVHMPRIGTGQGRGRWPVISGLIDEELVARECSVTIYEPPWQTTPHQQELPI
jgi:hypothetical protein